MVVMKERCRLLVKEKVVARRDAENKGAMWNVRINIQQGWLMWCAPPFLHPLFLPSTAINK